MRPALGKLVARYWNGKFGAVRRDIQVTRLPDDNALLEWWNPDLDYDGRRVYTPDEFWKLPDHIRHLMALAGGGGWKNITSIM